jgi:glycosyltransferase involved in cell wall biosynthesis
MIPTFNRRQYLPAALGTALAQDYRNIEVFVINDGGVDVSDIVASFRDERIRFINRRENRGKAYSLNEALGQARGKYVAYLDDDDIWYRNHIGVLVSALENSGEGAAYTDLYKSWCRIGDDGTRLVVAKKLEVSRDFDRFLMMHFNHVFHVSLMHRRELLEKTGPYNESLNVMIDWDMTRRLAFFTDFVHLCDITGEFFAPVGDSDRISIQRRKDRADYLRNIWTIRTTRPPKPWPMVRDVSVIFAPARIDESAAAMLRSLWMWTSYPFMVYLPWTAREMSLLQTDMPNITHVPVPEGSSVLQRIDAAVSLCDGDYMVVVPPGLEIREFWLQKALWPLMHTYDPRLAFEVEGSTDLAWCAVVKAEHVRAARAAHPQLELRDSLKASGISFRKPAVDELPFRFDDAYHEGRQAEAGGEFTRAAEIYQYAAGSFGNRLWMDALTAESLRKAGRLSEAAEYASRVNLRRPTVESLRTEALARKKMNDFQSAIALLEKARDILEGTHAYEPDEQRVQSRQELHPAV